MEPNDSRITEKLFLNNYETEKINKVLQDRPLYKFICEVMSNPEKQEEHDKIGSLSHDQAKNIFQEIFPDSDLKSDRFKCEMIVVCLRGLIVKRWNIYNGGGGSESNKEFTKQEMHADLTDYLVKNLTYVIDFHSKASASAVLEAKNYLIVNCPYKKLKTFFFSNGHPNIKESSDIENTFKLFQNLQMIDIIHWPHVEIEVCFPNFKFTRRMILTQKLDLVNLNLKEKLVPQLHTDDLSSWKPIEEETEAFPSSFVDAYLEDLINTLRSTSYIGVPIKRPCLLKLLDEIKSQIQWCDQINTNTIYSKNLNPYSYVRYLGQSVDRENIDTHFKSQICRKKGPLNIRLREEVVPRLQFSISECLFDYVYCEETKKNIFKLGRNVFHENKFKISYTCLLCDLKFFDNIDMSNMSQHLTVDHGVEPDWSCVKCGLCHSHRLILRNGWKHECVNIAEAVVYTES